MRSNSDEILLPLTLVSAGFFKLHALQLHDEVISHYGVCPFLPLAANLARCKGSAHIRVEIQHKGGPSLWVSPERSCGLSPSRRRSSSTARSKTSGRLGQELILRGRSVCFTSCALLVQRLLRAKSELWLEKELKRLDKFLALIIDDLGYVQQSREEMEVLFTLLDHRYEHRSVLLTSNLVFSDWERIFKDPMTTAAAVDRLVPHSVILELNLSSYGKSN